MTWRRLGRTDDCPAGIVRYLVRGDTLYVWCGGTRNRREWRWNFMTRKLEVGGMGARVNWKDWEQSLDVWCEMSRDGIGPSKCKRVCIGGYSRGYAVALILGWLIRGYTDSVTVIGWAGKRVGNRAFHDELTRIHIGHSNMSHRWDIVPWLPPHYARGPQYWVRTKYWPVKAHIEAGRLAAYWRHEVTQEDI